VRLQFAPPRPPDYDERRTQGYDYDQDPDRKGTGFITSGIGLMPPNNRDDSDQQG